MLGAATQFDYGYAFAQNDRGATVVSGGTQSNGVAAPKAES